MATRSRCPICQKLYQKQNSLQKTCFDPKCAIAYIKTKEGRSHVKRTTKRVYRADRQRFNANDLGHQHSLTKTVFNRMRVLEEKLWFQERGIQPHCISCEKTNMDWCCGHYKSVGAQGGLRYCRTNTYLQCNRHCNMGLSGNIEGTRTTVGYKQGLIERFGEAEGQRILDYCETTTAPVKWTCDYLISFRAECSAAIRDLEKVVLV